ncbi:MAG: hypothetical protein FJX66_04410 [Alphaproteobacteria bacterium]|nr:hypothetical protein [Alphaproteobacteria bacterium]
MTALRLCFIGDSIVNGYGDSTMLGWPGRVCAAARAAGHDVTHYNGGIRGDTSTLIRARWRAEIEARLPPAFPRALVFGFGINDCVHLNGARRVTPETSLENLRAMSSEAKALAPTLFIGPTPIDRARPAPQLMPGARLALDDSDIAALGRDLVEAARALGVPALDPRPDLEADEAWRRSLREGDGIHPGAEGYDALARLISAWPPWRALFGSSE